VHSWSLPLCPDGKSYNAECESACNAGYHNCTQPSANGISAIILTNSDEKSTDICSKVQSKCMAACYKAATVKCSAKPDSDGGNDTSNDEDSDSNHGRGSSEAKEALAGISIVVSAVLTLFLLVNNNYKIMCNDEWVPGSEEQREPLIGQDSHDEELNMVSHQGGDHSHGGLGNRTSDIVLANMESSVPNDANQSMITFGGMIASVQSSNPAIQAEGNLTNNEDHQMQDDLRLLV